MSAGARSRSKDSQVRPARRRTGLWVPALLSTLVLATVVGGIAVGHFFWSDLRSSMGRMDETLEHARERQRQMVEHFSRAQGLLLAQQRRLQEAEEALRAREGRLEAERADLEEARAHLALVSASRVSASRVSASREALEEQSRARELARRLDLCLATLPDPSGLQSVAETLEAVADWTAGSPLVAGTTLGHALQTALAESRDALAEAQAGGPHLLADRIERLGIQATGLHPGPFGSGPAGQTPSLVARSAGAGHLGEQLQTALFALSRGDEALFRLALDTAGAWLAAFYDPARPEVQAVQSEIANLHRLPVTQDLNPLRAGLARVRAVMGELIQSPGADREPSSGVAEENGQASR